MLRALSIASTLAVVATVYVVLRRHGAERAVATVCAAMFLAAHTRLGDGLDLARVDAPAVALAMLGLAAADAASRARDGRGSLRSAAVAAVVLAAGVLTKQTVVTAIGGASVAFWIAGRRARAALIGGVAAAIVVSVGAALHLASGGWSTFYFLTLPSGSPLVARDLALAVGRLGFFFPAALGALAIAVWRFRRRPWASTSVWETSLVLSVPAALITNARVGGADNVWMLVVPLAAIVVGRYWVEEVPALSGRHVLFYAIALQTAVLPHRPIAQVPTPADRQACEALVTTIRQASPPVFNPMFPYESLLAGRGPSPLVAQLVDYQPDAPVIRALAEAIRDRRLATIIATDLEHPLLAGIEGRYRTSEERSLDVPSYRGALRVLTPVASGQ